MWTHFHLTSNSSVFAILQLASNLQFHIRRPSWNSNLAPNVAAAKEAVGFVQDGEVLVSIGSDRDRTMALWPAAREGCFRIGRKEGVPLAPRLQSAPVAPRTYSCDSASNPEGSEGLKGASCQV